MAEMCSLRMTQGITTQNYRRPVPLYIIERHAVVQIQSQYVQLYGRRAVDLRIERSLKS
jgi:hypothetical protein